MKNLGLKTEPKINFFLKLKFAILFIFCISAFSAEAAVLGEIRNFNLDSLYDLQGRRETSAILTLESNKLYIYVDNTLWQRFSENEKKEAIFNLSELAEEFENRIYPILTSNYGFEWNPGIDNDSRITILFHPLKKKAGGYFNNGNEYSKLEAPTSNEREMVYLNSDYLTSPLVKQLLAHEFTHLIIFNQKERIQNIEEDVWLNEARAEYAPTLLGYDSLYQGSNLQKRVIDFLKSPSNSLIEWENSSNDYGVLNIFIQYLVDYYGIKILNDSLRSNKTGIESINYALAKNGYKEDFTQIFTDWTIAVLVNNCSLGGKYCYKTANLKNVKVMPTNSFFDLNSRDISTNYSTKNWSGNWIKIFGDGKGLLILEFYGGASENFKVPYLICDSSSVCSVKFLVLDRNQYGKIMIDDFNKKYVSLTIIPSSQDDLSFSGTVNFSWRMIIDTATQGEIERLLAQIATLQDQIARLQAQIAAILGQSAYCQKFDNDLYFGLRNNQEVRCLQEFFKNQGIDIYPEGLVTGNFLSLTQTAVIRFQEKYRQEILSPLGLEKGTGYVGIRTRAKINELIKQ